MSTPRHVPRSRRLALLAAVVLTASSASAADGGATHLRVGDDEGARIFRDAFGRPRIFAGTDRGLFTAYGFAVARDRLWQLELNRRAARGRLAELFGPGFVTADRLVRVTGYTDAELDAQFARLSPRIRRIYAAYADGINRYVSEVVAADPLALPFEFHALGIGFEPWTVRDSVAFGAFMTRRFGEIGGRELSNAALLADLVAAHGPLAGRGIFDDLRWRNDPDAPVTVAAAGVGLAPARTSPIEAPALTQALPAPLAADDVPPERLEDQARSLWESIGVPTRLGSYAWAVGPRHSTSRRAMLLGGPQMGFSAPEVLHEVQLTGGGGFHVTGMAFAGLPAVLIGRNRHVAWTSTTATGDNVDTYLETPCDAGAGPGSGTVFAGACRALEARDETIRVRGAAPVGVTVLRSVHGPIVGTAGALLVAQKRAHWGRELDSVEAFLAFNRARRLRDFAEAVRLIPTSHNFIYADVRGHIAYWQAGQVPVRPAGFDPRLPLPGDGSAEWPGGLLPIPQSIDPRRGWLANWNNKPSVDYDNADNQTFGKQFRLRDIEDRLAPGPVSLADMRDIVRDIARVKTLGREARFLKPYLLQSLDAVPPGHPSAPAARALLEAWDGNAVPDAVASTELSPAEVVFSAWQSRAIALVFGDELGPRVGEAGTNTLLHVLDFAFTGRSGVPPSRDYWNGADPRAVVSAGFDQAVAALAATRGPDPAVWTLPRGQTSFSHPLLGTLANIPAANRATYVQIVVLSRRRPHAENIFTLGQSGFVRLVPPAGFALDPHFLDQLELFRRYEYKPMPLVGRPDDDEDGVDE